MSATSTCNRLIHYSATLAQGLSQFSLYITPYCFNCAQIRLAFTRPHFSHTSFKHAVTIFLSILTFSILEGPLRVGLLGPMLFAIFWHSSPKLAIGPRLRSRLYRGRQGDKEAFDSHAVWLVLVESAVVLSVCVLCLYIKNSICVVPSRFLCPALYTICCHSICLFKKLQSLIPHLTPENTREAGLDTSARCCYWGPVLKVWPHHLFSAWTENFTT